MDIWDMAVYLVWSLLAMVLLFSGWMIIAGYIMGKGEEYMREEAEREVGS